jgi:hypothetical protein
VVEGEAKADSDIDSPPWVRHGRSEVVALPLLTPSDEGRGIGETEAMADGDGEITEALAKLRVEDAGAAQDAEAALEWLTFGGGLGGLTQERVQTFLWYGLPMKWLTDTEHHRRVVDALSRAFDLLDLARYAALCRSATTAAVLDAYERSDEDGRRAYNKADTASGIRPPDLEELEWGAVMRQHESAALSSTAEFLELAVAGSELVPGARGWKRHQQGLTRAHLSTARIDLAGRTWIDVIHEERLETWLEGRHSPTRRSLLEPLAAQLRHPTELPPEVEQPVPPLHWLLGELADGVSLTQTGNLNRAFVQGAAGRFGWWDLDLHSLPRSEDELHDLSQVRQLAQRLGLIRRSGRTLGLTTGGRTALQDPQHRWRRTATGLLPRDPFALAAGEATLAVLLGRDTIPTDELNSAIPPIVHEEGWREQRSGAPPDRHVISQATHATTNLLRALNLLATGAHWTDHAYGLTPEGRAIAHEALRQRAIGPKTSP